MTATSTDTRERIARTLCDHGGGPGWWEATDEEEREHYRRTAAALLPDIEDEKRRAAADALQATTARLETLATGTLMREADAAAIGERWDEHNALARAATYILRAVEGEDV